MTAKAVTVRSTKQRKTSTAVVAPARGIVDHMTGALLDIVRHIPSSMEKPSATPTEQARSLILHASSRAAIVSGTLALPPGPLGLLTVLPDLMLIWNIQRQLVSDIAAVHGKSHELGPEEAIHCLFRHAASQAVRDVVMRVGERFVIRRAPLRLIQSVMRRVGVAVTKRAAGRALARWLPVVGAVGIGGYAFYDTVQVGKTAMAFFGREVVRESDAAPAKPPSRTSRRPRAGVSS